METLEDRLAPVGDILSTFDRAADGWTVIDGAAGPTHVAIGGNPGGFVRAVDGRGDGVWDWAAPAKFLGDQSASHGANLRFDLKQSATTSQFESDDVALAGARLRLVYDLPANPGTDWTSYTVPLRAASGWRVGSRTGPAPSEAQLQAVLADLTALHIRGEYRTGINTGSLDNVRLERPAADLGVTVADAPDPAAVGQPVTYSITVSNRGPADATGVVIANSGPAGNETFKIGGLASGASKSVQVQYTPTAEGTLTNTATVTAVQDDPNLRNNRATASTFVDNGEPATIELASLRYDVSEGDPAAVLTVRRTGDLSGTSFVDFTTADGTATSIAHGRVPADYTTTSGRLTFRPRSNVAQIRVPIRDDTRVEQDETFRVVLGKTSAGALLGDNTSADVVIHDNDPSVSFVAPTSSIGEGAKALKIEARLQSASTQTVTVDYVASGGTATPGQDFLPPAGKLVFAPGQKSAVFFVRPVNDTNYEVNETAVFTLANPTNAFVGTQATHSVKIVDDDPQPPPQEPGSTPETALPIDLQTLPRQSFKDHLKGSIDPVDTFRVHLDEGEYLNLDVDGERFGFPPLHYPDLTSSTLTITAPDGSTTTIGPSREPDTGIMSNNPAVRFQAASAGDYLLKLETADIGGYRIHFHRIGVSENVPAPELLNEPGPMFAWFDGADTVGITGPTGYGFTLKGPWEQITQSGPKPKRQTLTLPAGSEFTLASPQGVALTLIANGEITIRTKPNLWGDMVGEVTTAAIKLPVSLGIDPINDLLADAFGSDVSVGVLTADWRISLGGRVVAKGNKDKIEDIAPFLAGVPYLRQKSPVTISAQIGEYTFDYPIQPDNPIEVVFDPGDPMLYVRADKIQNLKKPALGLSRHGLLEFVGQRDPSTLSEGEADDCAAVDFAQEAGDIVSDIYGHVYVSGSVPFKVWYVPFEAHGDSVYNLDADRDGEFLAGLFQGDDLFKANFDNLPNAREVLRDIQAGHNGSLKIKSEGDSYIDYEIHAGEATWVFNGPAEGFWFQGIRGQEGASLFAGTPLDFLDVRASDKLEAVVRGNGEFVVQATANYGVGNNELEFGLTISNEGITAHVTGKLEWSATVDLTDFKLGKPGGKARADLNVCLGMDIDGDEVSFWGSGTARVRVWALDKKWVDETIDVDVQSQGISFDIPYVDDPEWNPFD